jgi:phage shock protein A
VENKNEKEYLLSLLTQFKLNGKELEKLEEEIRIWEGRIELAGKAGKEDLVPAAETEAGKLRAKTEELKTETANLKAEIEKLRGYRELSAEIELAVLKATVEGRAGDRPSPPEAES